jgi:hypothetical protein
MSLRIYTCPEWHAMQPKQPIVPCPKATSIIFHHTAGHHAEISNPLDESIEEAKRYARDIQAFHMNVNGWNDSGHNFLVTRAGQVLQGRWKTVSAIQAGHMVVSAHCPGQNQQIGIEHEHNGTESMTSAQRGASAQLMAWIAEQYGLTTVLPVYPHRKFFATSCPANLVDEIPTITRLAQQLLT